MTSASLAHALGVDIIGLKVDRNTALTQESNRLNTFKRISRKALYTLYDYTVYLSVLTVLDKPFEIRSLVDRCSCDTFMSFIVEFHG